MIEWVASEIIISQIRHLHYIIFINTLNKILMMNLYSSKLVDQLNRISYQFSILFNNELPSTGCFFNIELLLQFPFRNRIRRLCPKSTAA